jgi:hypothetical protein
MNVKAKILIGVLIILVITGLMFFTNIKVKTEGNWSNYSVNFYNNKPSIIEKYIGGESKLLTDLANPRLQIRNQAGTEVAGIDHLGSGIFTGNISATAGATFGNNVNMSNNNITSANYIKFNKITGACDLTLSGSICANTTGVYIVG